MVDMNFSISPEICCQMNGKTVGDSFRELGRENDKREVEEANVMTNGDCCPLQVETTAAKFSDSILGHNVMEVQIEKPNQLGDAGKEAMDEAILLSACPVAKRTDIEYVTKIHCASEDERPHDEDPCIPAGDQVPIGTGSGVRMIETDRTSDNCDSKKCLPFAKTSPMWKHIESSEVFLMMPQRPHFLPLKQYPEELREGTAIGFMVTFAKMVNKIRKLQISDTNYTLQEMMETLDHLQIYGFTVQHLRDSLKEIQIRKENQTKLLITRTTLEELISERENKKKESDAKIRLIDKVIMDLDDPTGASDESACSREHSLKSTSQLHQPMLLFGKSTTKDLLTTATATMNDTEKCLDPQLWHACAGGMVQMPSVNSQVYYFPQGHAEHAHCPVDFGNSPRIPAFILSRVTAVRFMADPETDEVFAKIRLVPVQQNELDFGKDEAAGLGCNGSPELHEKPASFAKTLTQSDANNGGGFSVPRYCAETIFPRLDYSANPPLQTVLAKDVHGDVWKFRHIYRGTPRRHLLTTGWSAFVNQKKLVAGDSIVFLRTENGDLCVGIRRAKRGICGGPDRPSGWNPPAAASYGGFSVFPMEEESRLLRGNGNGGNMRGKGRVRAEAVIEAAKLAACGEPFEVVYYPRASTPEFCVKAAAVRTAMRVQWCPGMRFKMPFETEDSSRISWFMGTISSLQASDPIQWPNSPWRLLQVTWDEPDLLQNVKRVSPWLVELVSHMPAIHLAPFSPPRKKLCIPPRPDFPPDTHHLPPPPFPSTPAGSPLCCLPHDSTPAGIQGARHSLYGISLSDLHLSRLQSGLLHAGFHRRLVHAPSYSPTKAPAGLLVENPAVDDDICLLTIGSPSTNSSCNGKKPAQLVLFGQPIFTEQQISLSSSGSSGNSSSEGSAPGSRHRNGGGNPPGWFWNGQAIEAGLETGHCKVFMESEDVGRSLDLSVFGSYGELYGKLADMFGIDKSEMMSHVVYRDAAGAVKHTGDAPFSEFMRTARRLTIVMDSGSDNMGSCA